MNRSSLSRLPRAAAWISVLAAGVLAAACGGGGGDAQQGTLRVSLTDAPACGYDAVYVTVDRVRVHQSDTAADSDGGWQELVLAEPRRVDLLSLTNGVLEDLGSTTLPAGQYTQVRLVLADNSAADPMANSVIPTGAAEVALDTPSAQQSGLKIKTNFTVSPTQVADLVLDFDACKSVVKRGNSGRYNLKPVLTAIPVFAAAGNAVQGYVAPALANGSTAVSVQQAGVVVKATAPDAVTGKFVLSPVPVGTYDLVLTADGRVTSVITGVPVIDTARTTIGSETARLDPPTSTMRNANGTVLFTGGGTTIPDALVRALQKLTSGPSVELIARPTDAATGAFSYALPASAPQFGGHVAAPALPAFAADATVAGKYTLEALVPGKPTQTADIDLSAADVTTLFTVAP
jgi:hypothetical protein